MASLQLTLDPTSLILSQFYDPTISDNTLRLIPHSYLERGVNYDEYAQLRESSLRSKTLKLYNTDAISEVPVSEYLPDVMKSVQFHGLSSKFEEDELVYEVPKLEYSPSGKKSENFNGICGKFEEDELVSAIPSSEYSPLVQKSVKFNGFSGKFVEDELVSAIPRSEYSPLMKKSVKFNGISGKVEQDRLVSAIPTSESSPLVKKSMKFNGISGKFGEDRLVSAIPRSESSPLMKKPVKFNGISGKFEEDERVSATPKSNLLRKSVRIHEISKRSEELSPLVKKTMKTQGKNQVTKKENRNPTPEMNRNTRIEKNLTPPVPISKRGKINESPSKYSGGIKTMNSGEKQSSVKMMASRKSYASIEELKGLSICASNAINSEFRGGKKSNVLRKSTVFSTKYY